MSKINYSRKLIGLIGTPVDENPTGVIIEAAFRSLNINGLYLNMEVPSDSLEQAVIGIRALPFLGSHVTIPHKVEVVKYLDSVSHAASIMGAVNTIYKRNGKLFGENTDGKGFIEAMKQNHIPLAGKNVVILGAGGAARAISVELAMQGVSSITIINRSKERGQALAELLITAASVKADYQPWTPNLEIPDGTDILVQATSIGLYPDRSWPDINYAALNPGLIVCDIIPNPPHTKFLEYAAARGCRTFEGFDMLVYQAALSFKLWTGKDAPVHAMQEALAASYAEIEI